MLALQRHIQSSPLSPAPFSTSASWCLNSMSMSLPSWGHYRSPVGLHYDGGSALETVKHHKPDVHKCKGCGAQFRSLPQLKLHQDLKCLKSKTVVPKFVLRPSVQLTESSYNQVKRKTSDSFELPEPQFKVLKLSDEGCLGQTPCTTSSTPEVSEKGTSCNTAPRSTLFTSIPVSTGSTGSTPKKGAFKCSICDFSANKKCQLFDHMMDHDSTRRMSVTSSDDTVPTDSKTTTMSDDLDIDDSYSVSMTAPSPAVSMASLGEHREDMPPTDPRTPRVSSPVTSDDGRQRKCFRDMAAKCRKRSDVSECGSANWVCLECDIRFSSKSNFVAHKEFYCGMRSKKTRSQDDGTTVKTRSNVSSSSASVNPLLASMMPAMMPIGGGFAPGMMFPSPMLTPFGLAYPVPYFIPVPSNTVPSVPNTSADIEAANSAKQARSKSTVEQPLDLSLKREQADAKKTRSMSVTDTGNMVEQMRHNAQKLNSIIAQAVRFHGNPEFLSEYGLKKQAEGTGRRTSVYNQSLSHCEQCNIVFYNHENYVVHKAHYCAGRHIGKGAAAEQQCNKTQENKLATLAEDQPASPADKPTEKTEGHLSQPSSPKSQTEEEYTLQYYCLPCKIKFSSLPTLEAHQQYYCPTKKAIAEQANAAFNSSLAVLSQAAASSTIACPGCGVSFSNKDEMFRHVCPSLTGPPAMLKVPLYCCPHCDFVARTDVKILEHIKSHAPTKAYRCVKCGYRGNTMRGMRMHGKIHSDTGETFKDSDIVEFDEEPAMPKRLRTVTENIAISLPNMPEDRTTPQAVTSFSPSPSVAVFPGLRFEMESSNTVAAKMSAIDTSPKVTTDEVTKPSYKCMTCSFTTDSRDQLSTHEAQSHSDEKKAMSGKSERYHIANLISESPTSPKNVAVIDKADDLQTPTMLPHANAALIQQRMQLLQDLESGNKVTPAFTIGKNNSQENVSSKCLNTVKRFGNGLAPQRKVGSGKNYCKQCDISFVYLSTFLAHKRHYCSSHAGERTSQAAQTSKV